MRPACAIVGHAGTSVGLARCATSRGLPAYSCWRHGSFSFGNAWWVNVVPSAAYLWCPGGCFCKCVDRASNIPEQHVGHVAAEPVPYEHAHNDHVGDIRRHRIGGNLPAMDAQPVREIEQRVSRKRAILDHPGNGRNALATVAIKRQLERAKLAYLASDESAPGHTRSAEFVDSLRVRAAGTGSTAR